MNITSSTEPKGNVSVQAEVGQKKYIWKLRRETLMLLPFQQQFQRADRYA